MTEASTSFRIPQEWNPDFWVGRRVLLTGHTGFKGAWLAGWLCRLGAEVTGFSLPAPARESPAWQAIGPSLCASGLQDLRGDIRNPQALDQAVAQAQADVVLHLAAQALVLDSYAAPEITWDTNVMGSLHLLQALARHKHPATFIGITSDKCYENQEWVWGYRETDALGGHDPYSSSKAAMEILLASWRRSFGAAANIRVASARAGNVIGGGDGAANRIVPDLLHAFTQRSPAIVRRPHSVRPYQHVLEPLAGYLRLAQCVHENGHRFEQAYNFGPAAGDERSTQWLAQTAAACWGPDARLQFASTSQPHEAGLLMLDSAKARQELGWLPCWSAHEAIHASVDWHRAWLQSPQHAFAETCRQIDNHVSAGRYTPRP